MYFDFTGLKIKFQNQIVIYRYARAFCVLIQSQPAITCSKLTIEALERGVKYVQS